MKTNINLTEFLGEVNVYRLSFLKNSMTGKLIEHSNEHLKIETRNGNIISCDIECLRSILHIGQPHQEAF
jgi:hypothetical protein